MEELTRIYDWLGLPINDALRVKFESWLATNHSGAHGGGIATRPRNMACRPTRSAPIMNSYPRLRGGMRKQGVTMIEGRKILITGPAGQIAFPLAKRLAERNEVWGIARFGDPDKRREVEAAGIRTLIVDLENPDFGEVPRDFTHLLHLAASFDPGDYNRAIRINAEGTGLLLSHCRNVEASLVMSTVSVYKPHDDPLARLSRG